MGWTGCHVNKGEAGEYFKRMLNEENENRKLELLKGAFVGYREYYAAIRLTNKATNKSYVFAFVAMVQWHSKQHFNFYYKDMDETCGPVICHCPKSILELLSPVEETMESREENGPYGYAKNWRQNCWEYINSKPQFKSGDEVMDKQGIRYTLKKLKGRRLIANTQSGVSYYTTQNWLRTLTKVAA